MIMNNRRRFFINRNSHTVTRNRILLLALVYVFRARAEFCLENAAGHGLPTYNLHRISMEPKIMLPMPETPLAKSGEKVKKEINSKR